MQAAPRLQAWHIQTAEKTTVQMTANAWNHCRSRQPAAPSLIEKVTGTGEAVLIVGYDAQNVVLWTPGQAGTRNMGRKDATAMFATAGNLYFTCLP